MTRIEGGPAATGFDVVVVGGGAAGLVAATLLARAGRRVALLERAARPGGRAGSTEEGGAMLNLGPHALYNAGHAVEVLKELGLRPTGGLATAPGAQALLGGALHVLPMGLRSLLATRLLGWRGKWEFARLLRRVTTIDPTSLSGASVREWLDATFRDPVARALGEAFVRLATYAHAPDALGAEVAVRQLAAVQRGGVTYLDGGWQQLVDALARAAEQAGVVVRTHAAVTGIERDERGVRAVVLRDGARFEARSVVLAVAPDVVRRLLPDVALGLPARAEPLRAACLDLVLRGLPRPGACFALGVDRPLYLSVHTAVARLAPPGHEVVHVARYLAPGEEPDATLVEAELGAFMDVVQPGWRERVVARRFLPRLTAVEDLAPVARGGLRGRPPVAPPGAPGVFLAGDWVGDEGWLLDASLASARAAARAILARAPEALCSAA